MTTLWSQAAETWSATGVNEGTVGIEITVSSAGTLAGLWLYSPSGQGLTSLPTTIALYTVTGTALVTSQTPSWSASYGTGWVFAAFSSPPSLTTSTDYMAVVFGAAGSFGYDSSFTWPLSNGSLTGVNGGYYNIGSSLTYPGSQQTGWNWWVDASFTVATASPGSMPLTPPGITSPMVFRRRAQPSQAPPEIASQDAGTGNDAAAPPALTFTASARPGRARPGQAQPGNPGTQAVTAPQAPYALLVPPGFTSPAAFQRHAFPSPAPALAPSADTGAGADSGTVTATVSDSDAGSGADTSATGVPGSDTGTGADTGGVPGTSYPLVPPGFGSPMSLTQHAWPSGAPPEAASQDTGTGADSPSLTASAGDTDSGSGADTGSLTAAVSDADTGSGADTAAVTANASDSDAGSGANTGAAAAVGTVVQPLAPPGLASPMAFQGQRWPAQAPLEAASQDTGAGTDPGSLTADVSDDDAGSGADTSSLTASASDSDTGSGADIASATAPGPPPSAVLVPPSLFTPMSFRCQAWPAAGPVLAAVQDTGSGGDSGQPEPADTDTGSGTDAGQVAISGTESGTGADTGGAAAAGAAGQPLAPPGFASPMAWQRQSWPSPTALGVPSGDGGSGTDAGSVTASASDSDTGAGAGSASLTAGAGDSDAGSGADTGAVTVAGSDTGSAADAALAGAPGQSYPLVPPGLGSPMAWQSQAPPAPAPAQGAGSDAGSGADTATATALAHATGNVNAVPGRAVPGLAVPGRPLTLPAAVPSPPGPPLVPPGLSSPAAWQFRAGPSRAPLGIYGPDTGTAADTGNGGPLVTGADTGTSADSSAWAPPATGTGTVQRLNPVRETMTGLDVTLHLSTALGAVLQFASTGSERLYVLAADPGVTLTVTDGGMVLDQAAQPFPPVALQAGTLYAFGPFHSVVQVPGTSTVQVALSTTYGVQVLVVQGPEAH